MGSDGYDMGYLYVDYSAYELPDTRYFDPSEEDFAVDHLKLFESDV